MHAANISMNYVMIVSNLMLTTLLLFTLQTPNQAILREVKDQGSEIQVQVMSLVTEVSKIKSIAQSNQKWIAEADRLSGNVIQEARDQVQIQEWQKDADKFRESCEK